MSGLKSIKEVTEAAVFVCLLVSAVDNASEDGISIDDIALFMGPALKAPEAFAGIGEAKAELEDMDADEKKEFYYAIQKALDLHDDKIEAVAEKAILAVLSIYEIIKEVKALKA